MVTLTHLEHCLQLMLIGQIRKGGALFETFFLCFIINALKEPWFVQNDLGMSDLPKLRGSSPKEIPPRHKTLNFLLFRRRSIFIWKTSLSKFKFSHDQIVCISSASTHISLKQYSYAHNLIFKQKTCLLLFFSFMRHWSFP